MAVDYWPQEEGYIVSGAPVMMCKTTGDVGEMSCVKLSATTAGQVSVIASAAAGDSIGVALRAGVVTGQYIPVAFKGVIKILTGATLALGLQVQSDGTDSSQMVDTGTSANIMLGEDGSQIVMGLTLQEATNDEDEILVLLGRW